MTGREPRRPAPGWLDDEWRVGWLVLVPSLLAIFALAVLPLLLVAWLSLRRHMPVFDISRWVALDNYLQLAADPRFVASLSTTAYVVVLSVSAEIVLGLAIALVLNKKLAARGLLRAAVLVPWTLPTVVAAWTWRWLLGPEFGLLDRLSGGDANWLGDPAWAIHAIVIADVWKSTPFAVLLLLAGLQSIPPELSRAARVDGAGAWTVFWRITLPLLRPALLVTVLFRSLDAFRIFDVVYVMTGGGPANTTETLSVYAYELYFRTLQFGYGSAVALATFVIMLVLSGVLVLAIGRRRT